jgi:hypothetical protein
MQRFFNPLVIIEGVFWRVLACSGVLCRGRVCGRLPDKWGHETGVGRGWIEGKGHGIKGRRHGIEGEAGGMRGRTIVDKF